VDSVGGTGVTIHRPVRLLGVDGVGQPRAVVHGRRIDGAVPVLERVVCCAARLVRGVDRQLAHAAGGAGVVDRTEPRGEVVDRRHVTLTVRLDVAGFVLELDACAEVFILKELRVEAQGCVDALIILVGGMLAEVLMIPESSDADREHIIDQLLVDVEAGALAAVGTDTVRELAFVLERGVLQAAVLDTRRAAEAEEERVGAAQNIDTIGIVRIPGNVRDEVVAGVVGRGQAADALGLAWIAEGITLIVLTIQTGERAARAGHFGVGGVLEERGGVGRTDIVHHRLCDDGDGRAQVAQVATNTRTGEGFRCDVAFVLLTAHFERSELDDFTVSVRGASGDSFGCWGRLRE